MSVAALVTLPFGLGYVAAVTAPQWGMLTFSAVIGVVLAYTVYSLAAHISSRRVVRTLFSIDPIMGSLVGAVVMGETISLSAYTGIVLVSAAGALLVWPLGRRSGPN